MFDIIIRDGKKESYIKLNGNILKGFNAQNGEISSLTKEEVNCINLLKLSDNKSYLGIDNGYEIYLDNISGLKHYFKDGKEDFEATWLNNGEDGLIYKGDSKINSHVKKIKLNHSIIIISSMIIGSILTNTFATIKTSKEFDNNINDISYEAAIDETSSFQTENTYNLDLYDTLTFFQMENYIQKNNNLTEEEKRLMDNKKLLEDIIPYYENTNMKVLIPLKLDDFQLEYYLQSPDEKGNFTAAYYNPLIPNKIFVNMYIELDTLNPTKITSDDIIADFYDRKAHEYIHLLQPSYEYMYIIEASAEIISCEYDDKCVNASYLESVKNIKILMEIVGPEPIWKLNFSGDDTDLVNIIKSNLSLEQADKLIGFLKEDPSETKIENLDESITSLLSEMYTNMYGEEMSKNPFINCLLGNGEMHSRYYFNSNKITKEVPYTKEESFSFWHTYAVSDTTNIDVLNDIHNPNSEELYILFKNDVIVESLSNFTSDFLANNEVKFYCHGEEINFNSIDLEKYINIPITYQGDVPLQENNIVYYQTINELFPDQIIGQKEEFTK